jgi:hypothetical protein
MILVFVFIFLGLSFVSFMFNFKQAMYCYLILANIWGGFYVLSRF